MSRSPRKRADQVGIKFDAIKLMCLLARLEPHLPREYKYTIGRLLLDWSALLVYRIDRMLMLHDKGTALEEVAATVRTIEVEMLNLVALHAMPKVSPVTESEVSMLCVNIEEQARAMWRSNRDKMKSKSSHGNNPGDAIPPRQGAAPAR